MLDLLRTDLLTLADLVPDALMERIRAAGRTSAVAAGQLVQQRGDEEPAFYLVESGRVLAGTIGADGSFLTALVLGPGDHFGEFTLFAGLPRLGTLTALEAGRITRVAGPAFLALFDAEPALPRALLTISLRRIHMMMEFLDGQRRWPLPVRIAHLLRTAVPEVDAVERFDVRVRQEDLAQLLGVSRVAVGKGLRALADDGFVRPGYGFVALLDAPALAAWFAEARQVTPVAPLAGWSMPRGPDD